MSVARCQRETTFPEFIGWVEFFRREDEAAQRRVEKLDWYLAQIAAEIRVSWLPNERKSGVKVSDFLLKFKNEAAVSAPEKTREECARDAKAFFGAAFGTKIGEQ